jgi:plastocyanin
MKRTLTLIAATFSVAAIPLVSAESYVNVTNDSTVTVNGETKNWHWSYTSADANYSAPSFSMPAMPAMPAMSMPSMPDLSNVPGVTASPSVLSATKMAMPSMPNLQAMMAQMHTRFAKVHLCRETFLKNPPFTVDQRKSYRLCIREAMGMGDGSWMSMMSMPMMSAHSSSKPSSSSSMPSMSSSSSMGVQGNQVTISGFAFAPQVIQVKKGTTVTWTNQDNVAHTVTGDAGGPASGLLNKSQTFSYTFNTVGNFPYHCMPHPHMTGIVQVTE